MHSKNLWDPLEPSAQYIFHQLTIILPALEDIFVVFK